MEVVDDIRDKGIFERPVTILLNSDDKTPFYTDILKTNNIPCYSFAALRYYDDDIELSPSLLALAGGWSSLMCYYGFGNRDILEMEIPLTAGVLGSVYGCELIEDEWIHKDAIELVTPCFKREWVKEIYRYEGVEDDDDVYISQLNTDQYALFRGTCRFNHSYIICREHMWAKPRTGFTIFENSRRLSLSANKQFLERVAREYLELPFNIFSRDDLILLMLLLGDYIVEEI